MANKRKHPPKRRPQARGAPKSKPRATGPLAGFTASERRELEKVFEMALRGAQFDLTDTIEPLDAQAWASTVRGVWYGRHLIGHDTDQVFLGGLIDFVARTRPPAGVRILRALAGVLDDPYATTARREADRLVAAGQTEPPWAGAVAMPAVPTRAAVHSDPVDDDGDTIMVEYTGVFGTHTIGTYIDRNVGGIVKDAFLNPEPLDVIVAKLREKIEADGLDTDLPDIRLEEASARIGEALSWTDRTLEAPISDDMRMARALLGARVRDLPSPQPPAEQPTMTGEEKHALIEEFMQSHSLDADPELVADVAWQILWYSTDYAGGAPLRFSPVMVELFCCDWAPRKVTAVPETFEAMPDVLRAWIRFVGSRRGIPTHRIEDAVAAVAKHEHELLAASADLDLWGPAKTLALAMDQHGIDMTDPEAMQAFIDQVNAGALDIRL